jgi:hypothetical protein
MAGCVECRRSKVRRIIKEKGTVKLSGLIIAWISAENTRYI